MAQSIYEVQEDEGAINAALQWENREDFFTRGKLKSVGGAVGGAALGAISPLLGGVPSAVRAFKTLGVMGALEGLLKSGISNEAKKDVQYILDQKQKEAIKAEVAALPVPILSQAPLAWNMAGAIKRDRGKDRREVAARIHQKIKTDDEDYHAIVFALFTNKEDPGLFYQRLRATSDTDLAVKVLMGKIASR